MSKLLYRSLRMDAPVDSTNRTTKVSFSSEQAVRRYDWGRDEYYMEILGHEQGNVDLSRLSDLGVVLFNHDRDKVIGAVECPALDAASHRCLAAIRFDKDDDSEKVYQKVYSGTLKGISVGYSVSRWEIVTAGSKSSCGRFDGPCRIAREWQPYEISVVSIPADTAVGIGRDFDGVDDETIEEFRAYLTFKRDVKKQGQETNALRMKEIEILEMEG
ncbi:HK97 family phage prohead protease [uncultured Phascolarctobacterium sp.]|uniref:HK97 family phage prohead protease n=1 Tax=uncultured Phascolarctobacterium sp. TaxID=512296 RepID=UPI0015AED716|nr:HK97 family phage prohead protease [uncultured Phascolarctobacterium sp.]